MGGVKAMRAAKEKYLPKFEVEAQDEYDLRVKHAKMTNVFRDIVENLAQRPFGKEVAISDGAPSDIVDFIEDVDGRGNNLHVFASDTFFSGIANAVDWILVDYTKDVPEGATRAVEAEIGARPYWRKYDAKSVLAAYSDQIAGKEEFTHVRLAESSVVRDGFGEKRKNRVRVFNREPLDGGGYSPATVTLWEENDDANEDQWIIIEPESPISIGIIPLVPFISGRRIGSSWVFHPPMKDAADLQIELYQQENGLKNAKTYSAFPMLAGNGISAPLDDKGQPASLVVGPKTVLFGGRSETGQGGSWSFIEPSATSLRFLADDIKETILQLRELGRQPLTAQSGNLTVVTTAFAAQKGNAAIHAWALNLKDALENALDLTAMWLNVDGKTEVMIDTDFDLGFGDDASFAQVLSMYQEGLISREAVIHEAKRRGLLDPSYDGDDDLESLLGDMDDEQPVRIAAE